MNKNVHTLWALVEELFGVDHQLLGNESEEILNFLVLVDAESISWSLDLI